MSDRHPGPSPFGDDPVDDAELGPLTDLLQNPAVWEDPDPDLGDAVVAAVQAEAARAGGRGTAPDWSTDRSAEAGPGASSPTGSPRPPDGPHDAPGLPENVVPLQGRSRRWVGPLLGAAAALLLVAAIGLGTRLLDTDQTADVEVALAGTDLAPEASATVEVTATPLGTRLILDVRDLPPAPDGQYYEAWLRQSPEIGVSAGTFHLRGGDGTIELWSGVTVDDYPLITVTVQDELGGAASSGRVVLAGRADEADGG